MVKISGNSTSQTKIINKVKNFLKKPNTLKNINIR